MMYNDMVIIWSHLLLFPIALCCSFNFSFIYILVSIPRESGRQPAILFSFLPVTFLFIFTPFPTESEGGGGGCYARLVVCLLTNFLKCSVFCRLSRFWSFSNIGFC